MMFASTSIMARVIGVIRLDPPTIRSITRDPGSTPQAAAVVAIVAVAAALGNVEAGTAGVMLLSLALLTGWGIRSGHAAELIETIRSGHGHGAARAVRRLRSALRQISAQGPIAGVLIVAIIVAAVVGISFQLSGLIGGLLLPILAWLIFSGVASFTSSHVFGEPTTRAEFAPILRIAGFALAPGVLVVFNVIPFIGGVAITIAILWGLVAVTVAIRQTVMIGTVRAALTTVSSALATLVICGVLSAIFG